MEEGPEGCELDRIQEVKAQRETKQPWEELGMKDQIYSFALDKSWEHQYIQRASQRARGKKQGWWKGNRIRL